MYSINHKTSLGKFNGNITCIHQAYECVITALHNITACQKTYFMYKVKVHTHIR